MLSFEVCLFFCPIFLVGELTQNINNCDMEWRRRGGGKGIPGIVMLISLFQHTSYLIQIFIKPDFFLGFQLVQQHSSTGSTGDANLTVPTHQLSDSDFYQTSILIGFHSAPQSLLCWSSLTPSLMPHDRYAIAIGAFQDCVGS